MAQNKKEGWIDISRLDLPPKYSTMEQNRPIGVSKKEWEDGCNQFNEDAYGKKAMEQNKQEPVFMVKRESGLMQAMTLKEIEAENNPPAPDDYLAAASKAKGEEKEKKEFDYASPLHKLQEIPNAGERTPINWHEEQQRFDQINRILDYCNEAGLAPQDLISKAEAYDSIPTDGSHLAIFMATKVPAEMMRANCLWYLGDGYQKINRYLIDNDISPDQLVSEHRYWKQMVSEQMTEAWKERGKGNK